MSAFADRLKKLRGTESQQAFSSRCGIGQTTYSSYESGNKEPTISKIVLIARATGVSTDWLLGLTHAQSGASASADASARYGSAVATNRSTATVAPSADTGRLVEIIAAQQRTIDRLAASITGGEK